VQSDSNLTISAYWRDRQLSGAEYLNWIADFVEELRQAAPWFATLHVLGTGRQDSPVLFKNREDLFVQLIDSLPRDIAYQNADIENKAFSLSSICGLGFSHTFATTLDTKTPGCLIEIRVGKSSADIANTVIFTISDELYESGVSLDLFEHVINFCDPQNACFSREAIDEVLSQPPTEIRVGWLTYIQNSAPERMPETSASISSFAKGILIQCSEHPPIMDGEEDAAPILSVYRAMREAGVLRK
jgi:hypothetical protein